MFREAFVTKVELGRSRLILSLLLHCLFVLVIPNLQLILPGAYGEQSSAYYRQRAVIYRMPLMAPTKMLPRVAPAGPGGRPGNGSLADLSPLKGKVGSSGKWTVIYKPLHPDNHRQTIRQLASPPDLQITQEIKSPDIIFGNLRQPQRPILHLEVKNAKPIIGTRQAGSEALAAPDVAVSINSSTSAVPLVNDHPRLPVEALATSRPILRQGGGESGTAAPDDAGFPGAGNGLLVLSVNPGWSSSQPALPPGNREGEFAISPGGGRNGSPGGSPDGVVGGGSGSAGNTSFKTGGDGSTATGPGDWGGGGGKSADAGPLTVNGTGGPVESVGVLRSNFIASMVYPVEKALVLPRKSQLVVATGPMGGGGLNVYGALHCGKIYTIFLEMPGKNWTMQFCQHGEKNESAVKQTQSAVVHLEEGLVAPYAESKFDFRRLPVPEKDFRKLIVLKGVLQEDGTVGKLEIYQGLLSEMDEAAKLALGRWKFKPATRAKIPVAVDILVGIPGQVPRQH